MFVSLQYFNIFFLDKIRMATFTGVLLDVSGSMRQNAGDETNEKGGAWALSIFDVIDSLIKYDVSSDNHIFSVGVGANGSRPFFDVIKTVKEVKHIYEKGQPDNDAQLEQLWEQSLPSLRIAIEQEQCVYMEMQQKNHIFMKMKMQFEKSLYHFVRLQWEHVIKPCDSLDM